jgi:hypothetical protein
MNGETVECYALSYLSPGSIEDDLVSGLQEAEWLVRNGYLGQPIQPMQAIRFGGKCWLWLLSQSAKPCREFSHTQISEISSMENPSPYRNIIHHTLKT